MDELYLAVIMDRHTDPEIAVFTTAQAAVNYARKTARENCRHLESYKESPIDGWLFHVEYSTEGDYAYVEKTGLNEQ